MQRPDAAIEIQRSTTMIAPQAVTADHGESVAAGSVQLGRVDREKVMVGPVRRAIPPVVLGISLAAPLSSMAASPVPAEASESSIPFANRGGIRNWQADGSKGVWIQATGGKWYYASFSSPCNGLPFSEGLRFVPEPTGDLSRWSSIRLAHAERCFFRSLQPSNGPPKKNDPSRQQASPGAEPPQAMHDATA